MNAIRFSKTPLGRALLQVAGLRRRPVVLLAGMMRRLREWRPPLTLAPAESLKLKSAHADPRIRRAPRPPLPITPTVSAHVASTKPSEHQSETEFLRHCLHYGNHAEHQALGDRIAQLQRDVRCVQRAVWLMAVLTALAATGLGYVALLGGSFPSDASQYIINAISALGLASVISLVAFVGLAVVFRMNLDEQRQEGRQLITKLLASRLGKPATTPRGESGVAGANGETISSTSSRGSPTEADAGSNGSARQTASPPRT